MDVHVAEIIRQSADALADSDEIVVEPQKAIVQPALVVQHPVVEKGVSTEVMAAKVDKTIGIHPEVEADNVPDVVLPAVVEYVEPQTEQHSEQSVEPVVLGVSGDVIDRPKVAVEPLPAEKEVDLVDRLIDSTERVTVVAVSNEDQLIDVTEPSEITIDHNEDPDTVVRVDSFAQELDESLSLQDSFDSEDNPTQPVDAQEDLLTLARQELGLPMEEAVTQSEIVEAPTFDDETTVPSPETTPVDEPTQILLNEVHTAIETAPVEKVEEIAVVLVEVSEVVQDFLTAEATLEEVEETVVKLLEVLGVETSEESVARIIAVLTDNQVSFDEIIKTHSMNDKGTREILESATNFFQQFTKLLEPLHTLLGRTVLSATAR